MKKVLLFIMMFAIIFGISRSTYAAEEYSFDLTYNGTILKNVQKDAVVTLTGVNGTLYTNVQIKVEVSGPAIPKLLATDSTGVEHDIAKLGYWGTVGGFPVQGSFINSTQIKATFPEEGSYSIKLSLIDLANANNVITSKTFNIEVYEDQTTVENTVEELPKTGTSIYEYILYLVVILIVLTIIGIYINKKKVNN